MFCDKCGAKIDDDALFCPQCGNNVNNDHESEDAKADTTQNSAPSETELKNQKRITKIMACVAVSTLILACLFVLSGTIKPGIKKEKPDDSVVAHEDENGLGSEETAQVTEETAQVTEESGYVSKVSEIPSDLMEKVKAQTMDNITAYAAGYLDDNISIVQSEYIGAYLLRKKESSNAKHENILDVAYAVTASIHTKSGKERKATMLFYTSFFDLKKNADGSVETDLGNYETPGSSFVVDVSTNGKKEKYYFVGYETVDAMYKDLVLKNVDQYSYDGNVQYEAATYDYAEDDNLESINSEFGIDSSTAEDYTANLSKDYFGHYDYGVADFSFGYPLYIYNNVTKNEESFSNDYGTNVVTYTFTGSQGSRLVYSLTRRDDNRSIKDMSKYVYSNETNLLIDSSDIVNSVSGDHGKVIVTGWEDTTKDFIIYDMTKIEKDYVLQMKAYMTNFTDDIDKNVKSYVTECDYRYCGFSDSKYEARTYEEYLDENQNTPFYGVWCFGSKDENDAIQFADTLSSSGITAIVFDSSNWSNLNQEKFYVVSAGVYFSEEEANDVLKKVQNLGYSSAYVKYSGDFLGSD